MGKTILGISPEDLMAKNRESRCIKRLQEFSHHKIQTNIPEELRAYFGSKDFEKDLAVCNNFEIIHEAFITAKSRVKIVLDIKTKFFEKVQQLINEVTLLDLPDWFINFALGNEYYYDQEVIDLLIKKYAEIYEISD